MYFLRMGEMTVPGVVAGNAGARDRTQTGIPPIPELENAARMKLKTSSLKTNCATTKKERAEHVMLVDLGRNDVAA